MSTTKSSKKTASKKLKHPLKPKKLAKKAASSEMCSRLGEFHWNELQTTDVAGAKTFYTKLFGWTTAPFGGTMDYTILLNEGQGFGGIMKAPRPGQSAMWLNYAVVKSVDATLAKLKKLGGQVCCPPFDVPGVGRLSIVQDPQGAVFGIHAPKM